MTTDNKPSAAPDPAPPPREHDRALREAAAIAHDYLAETGDGSDFYDRWKHAMKGGFARLKDQVRDKLCVALTAAEKLTAAAGGEPSPDRVFELRGRLHHNVAHAESPAQSLADIDELSTMANQALAAAEQARASEAAVRKSCGEAVAKEVAARASAEVAAEQARKQGLERAEQVDELQQLLDTIIVACGSLGLSWKALPGHVAKLTAERDALKQAAERAGLRERKAWEDGFKLCRSYGDNWFHFDGEQKERQWLSRQAALQAPQGPRAEAEPGTINGHRQDFTSSNCVRCGKHYKWFSLVPCDCAKRLAAHPPDDRSPDCGRQGAGRGGASRLVCHRLLDVVYRGS
jgi:hypothetical protein